MKFGESLNKRVDMSKVKLDVLRPWISKKITDILHIEDDVIVEFVYNQLEEEKFPCPKKMQINMTGFLNGKNARVFMDELWALLLSAQDSDTGIPAEFIQQKKDEILKREEEAKLLQDRERKSRSLERQSKEESRMEEALELERAKQAMNEERESRVSAIVDKLKSLPNNNNNNNSNSGSNNVNNIDSNNISNPLNKDIGKPNDKSKDRKSRERSRDRSRDRSRERKRSRPKSMDRSKDRRRSRSNRRSPARNDRKRDVRRRSRSRDNRRDRYRRRSSRSRSRSTSRKRESRNDRDNSRSNKNTSPRRDTDKKAISRSPIPKKLDRNDLKEVNGGKSESQGFSKVQSKLLTMAGTRTLPKSGSKSVSPPPSLNKPRSASRSKSR